MEITKRQLRKIIKEELHVTVSPSNEKEINEDAMDWIQGGLDVVGLVPVYGEAADAINALISLGRGNPFEALLSAISMIPGAGDVVGKSGKVVLKVFGPAIDLIKRGDDIVDIVKVIGPEKIKKIEPAITAIKNAAAKYGPQLKKLLGAIKSKDLDAVEGVINIKIPGAARAKAQTVINKVSGQIPEADIDGIFKFLAKIDLGDKIFGRGDGESSQDESGEEAVLAAGYVHEQPLGCAVFGGPYVNELLEKHGNDIAFILRGEIK